MKSRYAWKQPFRNWMLGSVAVLALYCFGVAIGTGSHRAKRPVAILDFGSASTINSFPKGQCTWYAFERSLEFGRRIHFSRSYGRDAKNWPSLVSGRITQSPVPGSLMILAGWKGNEYGHVAYVESVAGSNRWTISHANMGAGTIFANLDGIDIRKCDCLLAKRGWVQFSGSRNLLPIIGFLSPRAS